MTGPREELLSTGSLGPEGVALLYRTVEQVVRVRHLPPPEGADKWSPDMLLEAAHDVYLHRKGAERLLSLAAGTSDEDGFRQKLWRMVVNDLASMNRRTARGKLHERLKDVTAGMFGVSVPTASCASRVVPSGWTRPGSTSCGCRGLRPEWWSRPGPAE